MRACFLAALLLATLAPAFAQGRPGGGQTHDQGPPPQLSNYQPRSVYLYPTVRAQHVIEGKKLDFRSDTQLVQVPVIVTDKNGAHVSGLTADDFTVKQDGHVQKVSTFEEVRTSAAPGKPTAAQAGTFSNAIGDAAPRNVTLILIDQVNTPFLDQAYARQQLVQYLSQHVRPGETIGLLKLDVRGLHVLHDFSSDPAALVAAMNRVAGGIPKVTSGDPAKDLSGKGLGESLSPDEARIRDFVDAADTTVAKVQQGVAIEQTLAAFLDIAESMRAVPGRKALIWLTSGLPFLYDGPNSVPGGTATDLYTRAVAAMNDANLAVYPVDARGLFNDLVAADATRTGTKASPLNLGTEPGWFRTMTQQSLRGFAEMTGGRPFYNRNDLSTGLELAVADSSQYYLVGYYLDTKETRSGWHKLDVAVRREGSVVRHRGGFFETDAIVDPETARQMEVAAALQSPLDATALPLSGQWLGATPATNGKAKVSFRLQVPGNALTIDSAAKNRLQLEIVGVAKTVTGSDADHFLQRLDTNLPDQQVSDLAKEGLHYDSTLLLAPGTYVVRFVVRDNATGRLGSVSAPLLLK